MKRICTSPDCCNKAIKHSTLCAACKKRKYREKYPVKSAYQALRDNAKRRGKAFTLTLQEFECFAIKTEYMIKKGRTKEAYHIDRINEHDGYTSETIQILTCSDNIRKYLTWKWDESRRCVEYKVETAKVLINNDSPF